MRSLSARLLLGTVTVLVVFVVLTGLAVSWSVKQRAEAAVEQRLQGLVYGILGASDVAADGTLTLREGALPERSLTVPGSGLYAEIVGNLGQRLWRSRSSVASVPAVTPTPIGEWRYEPLTLADGKEARRLQLQSVWELDEGKELAFVVQVVDTRDVATAQLVRFDRSLWATLGLAAVLLLLVQLGVLRAALRPLRALEHDIDALSRGERDRLGEALPRELEPLAASVNALRDAERTRHARSRHLLDDLAHNLKTPLTVLGNLDDARVRAHAAQMHQSIERYLQRATAGTTTTVAAAQPLAPIAARVADTMRRLYAERGVRIEVDVPAPLALRLPEADLFEVIGNLVDNACKYGACRVRIGARAAPLTLTVSDDGPGLGGADPEALLQRGVRADRRGGSDGASVEGRGLGLAAVHELVGAWGGSLRLRERSPHGLEAIVTLPVAVVPTAPDGTAIAERSVPERGA